MWRFREVELDAQRRELRHRGTAVHLEPQAFDLLVYLIDQRDRLVSKVELLDGVWGHRFVSDANLTTRVKEIRRAVGDDGAQQHTIKNVRGRGYRFVAQVDFDEVAQTGRDASTLIGREADLAATLDALAHSRVVTVVGPGGVGKSALARAVAVEAAGRWRDGVHFVELGALDTGTHLLAALAGELDVAFDNQRAEDTIRSIARLHVLLILDNCEHLADDASSLVDRLMNVPGSVARVLATSQLHLGAMGESIIELRPLSVDDGRELFAQRAQAALRSWDGVPDSRVDRLVAALDRLPLTIEIAAARVRSMTFDDLERVIVDSAGLLQLTHRSSTRRHRSLESMTSWSASTLEPRHLRVFTEFSVFAGGVTDRDAVAVLAPGDPLGVALDLAALAERSLLVADVDGDETRYSMLSTVRAVASKWLDESGMASDAMARYADHIAASLRDVDDELRTLREGSARRRITQLIDEARAAHSWARQHRPELAAGMSGALFHAAYSSLWNEPAEWSQALLADQPADDIRFAGAALVVAGAAAHRGELARARQLCEPIVEATTGRLRTNATELLGDLALYEGNLDAAAAIGDQLLRIGEDLGDGHAVAFGAVDCALARTYAGDPAGALDDLDARMLRDPAPTDAAWIAYTRGDALSMLEDPAAADSFRDAIRLGRSVGNRFVVSVSRVSLANEHARAGDIGQSLDEYAAALADFIRHGNTTHAITAIRNLIGLLESIGDDHSAVVLAGAVSDDRLRVSYGVEAERINEMLGTVRKRVGETKYRQWLDEGRSIENDCVRAAAEIVDRHRS